MSTESYTFRPIIMSRKEQLMNEEALDSKCGRLSPAETIRRSVNNVVQPLLTAAMATKKIGSNPVDPLLTDLYQITMAYGYWESGRKDSMATFDLFFRRNPFKGEYTIFAGLDDCLKFVRHFCYTDDDIKYLKTILPDADPDFFDYLKSLTANEITIRAIPEGTVVFPKVPLMTVYGPLIVCQLLETTLLNLVNFASLVATNATRYRKAAGKDMQLLEFGLRRAQGPDGGLSASKYIYMGGFDATSNVLAGKLYGIPVKGTHAHAFVMSYKSTDQLVKKTLKVNGSEEERDFVAACEAYQKEVCDLFKVVQDQVSKREFAAFIAYAHAFPKAFLALIDTYDVIRAKNEENLTSETILTAFLRFRSGVINFCAIALALNDFGYKSIGIRLDSGDLCWLSKQVYDCFQSVADKFNVPWFTKLTIVASNDINEEVIQNLNDQGHKINSYGIGTHLVTCQRQPALGCVYKLVEIDNEPCIKLSLDVAKVTIPGKKLIYRLYGKDTKAILDLMQLEHEEAPKVGHRLAVRHPFEEIKRMYVTPSKVDLLSEVRWTNGRLVNDEEFDLEKIKSDVRSSLHSIREDIRRHMNPTPYKVSVSYHLYDYIHELWLDNAPMGETE